MRLTIFQTIAWDEAFLATNAAIAGVADRKIKNAEDKNANRDSYEPIGDPLKNRNPLVFGEKREGRKDSSRNEKVA